MNIAITGALGFTGRHFIRHAINAGHTVKPIMSDLSDRHGLVNELRDLQPDAVVHLAAISFVGHSVEAAFYAVNVVGTTNLLTALLESQCRPKCVLIASSANVYGNCQQSPITECQVPAPVNHYAASKMAMEHMALTFLSQLPVVLVRPFNYTGPGQATHFVIPKLVDHFKRRTPSVELGNMHVEREYNSIDFICRSYLYLLSNSLPGSTYNICTGQTYSMQQVLLLLQKLTGHTLEVIVNPELIRANEVHRLCGDPTRLRSVWQDCKGLWPGPNELESTLTCMLEAE